MKKFLIPLFILSAIGITMYAVFNPTSPAYNSQNDIPYSDFIEDVRNKAVAEVVIDGRYVDGRRQNGTLFSTYNPSDARMIDELLEYGVKIKGEKPQIPSTFTAVFQSGHRPWLLIAVMVYFMARCNSAPAASKRLW